jgi:glycosyltransferase involved in cell wall biosynthesis
VLLVSPDFLPFPGLPTVGSGLRAWGLGQGLRARGHDVVFSIPDRSIRRRAKIPAETLELAWGNRRLDDVVARSEADVVVCCGWPIIDRIDAVAVSVPFILDQHGPHLLERQYAPGGVDDEDRTAKRRALAKADYFTCAGAKQLEYFQQWLAQAGWTKDECRTRSAVIPVSLDPDPPVPRSDGELVFVYGGVFLPWQDPSRALLQVRDEIDRRRAGRLRIFGGRHPIYDVGTGVFDQLVAELGRSPRVAIEGMVEHRKLIDQYRRAHVAVDLMARNPERELAFTTRTVEYLWCGLPVIHDDYSELSDYIARYDAGWTVEPDNADALGAVLDEIFGNRGVLERKRANAQRLVREQLNWSATIDPLGRFVRDALVRPGRIGAQPTRLD